MYIPRHFAVDHLPTLHDFMERYGFATLITTGNGAPVASHLPLMIDREAGEFGTLIGHMARPNPQWRGFDEGAEALAVFHGPHAYISPSWYESSQKVPTWNYTAVHAYGVPRIIDDHDAVLAGLENMVAFYESGMDRPWRIDSQADDYRDMKMRGIVAFEIPISRVEGKFKLNQNKPEADRKGAVKGLRESGEAQDAALADLMESLK